MRLVSFSVQNYRSITKANNLTLKEYTVLVGPNNEGKSNLLRGLVAALNLVTNGVYSKTRRRSSSYTYSYHGDDYSWNRDIPSRYRDSKAAKTNFTLGFELSDNEKKEFRQEMRSSLNAILYLRLELGLKDDKFDIIIQGKGKQTLLEKKDLISKFHQKSP